MNTDIYVRSNDLEVKVKLIEMARKEGLCLETYVRRLLKNHAMGVTAPIDADTQERCRNPYNRDEDN